MNDPDLSEFFAPKVGRKLRLDYEVFPSLDAERRDKLLAALASENISSYRIMVVLRSWGHNVHENSVRNWRAKHHGRT